jgi:hypothetical protein
MRAQQNEKSLTLPHGIKINDLIYLDQRATIKDNSKTDPQNIKFIGPYKIVGQTLPTTFLLDLKLETRSHSNFHIRHLKKKVIKKA